MARIVVVEDETELRELIVEEMTDFGHEVHAACNGAEGLRAIEARNPDIVLADINMPVMNGYQMRSQLKDKRPDLARKPFIFVSAYADKADIADGMLLGADHYVTKPIDFDLLGAWIADLCKR